MSATRPLDVSLTLEGFIRETFLLFFLLYLRRVSGNSLTKGQIVNLGSPECLYIGTVLHEVLHALGLSATATKVPKMVLLF